MTTPLRALIVDDSEDDTLLIVRELQKGGFQPQFRRVDTAPAMRAALNEEPWDVIIADYVMPGFSGPAALRVAREGAWDIPFLIVSGLVGEEIAVEAMLDGAQDYVRKDNLRRLVPAIRRELHEAEIRRQRREAEQRLQASQERLRLALRNSPIVVSTQDLDLRYTWVLDSAVPFFSSDPVGKSDDEVFSRPDDAARLTALKRRVLTTGNGAREELCLEILGSPRYVDLAVEPLRAETGEPAGVTCVAIDVTERRRAEKEHEELQHRYLQAQKLEAIGRLAGGVAHDFNNLLSVILSYAAVIAREGCDRALVQEASNEIRLAAERAAGLTRQLLAFSRFQYGMPREANLNDVLRHNEKMLRRIIGEDIVLRYRMGDDLWTIRADPVQLEQAIMNLAVNARDAMPGGGVLTFRTENRLVREGGDAQSAVEPGEYVRLRVTDTGCGMDEHTLSRAFEPFFTTKPPGQGTGLGLSTVHGIVTRCQGTIQVRSKPGKGTTFDIWFPRALHAEQVPGPPPPDPAAPRAATILVIEDDEGVRRLIQRQLEPQGYRVVSVPDGEEAQRVWEQRKAEIDLLLTDVLLPGTDGKQLYERFRADQPTLGVVFMSGYPTESLSQRGIDEHSEQFLRKPFTLAALLEKIQKALDTE